MNILDLDTYDKFIGLFVGRSGGGKTCAIASIAKRDLERNKKTLLIDIDKRGRGMLGLRDVLGDKVLQNIEVKQDIDASAGFAKLDEHLELLIAYQNSNNMKYGSIIYEGISTMHKMFLYDSMRLRGTTGGFKGKERGKVKFLHPDDYNYASMAFHQLMYNGWMKLSCNVIVSGWIVDKWGKPAGEGNEYAESEVVGHKLLATDKFSEEIPGYFDEIYLFEKEETGASARPLRYTVAFEGCLAKTSREALKGRGKVDITNKLFFDEYEKLIKEGVRK